MRELSSLHLRVVFALVALRRATVPDICRFATCSATPVIELIRTGLLGEVADVTGDLDKPLHVTVRIRPEADARMEQACNTLQTLLYGVTLPELPNIDDSLDLARDHIVVGETHQAEQFLDLAQHLLDEYRAHIESFYQHGAGLLHKGMRQAAEAAISELQGKVDVLTYLIATLRS
ncbi:MAG: hypothetical protein KBD24_03930 [Candidatus Pacebacteria bacterium]|nr:hypothetical protein [Candidatus Paceibacterota bacterium]